MDLPFAPHILSCIQSQWDAILVETERESGLCRLHNFSEVLNVHGTKCCDLSKCTAFRVMSVSQLQELAQFARAQIEIRNPGLTPVATHMSSASWRVECRIFPGH